MQPIGFEWDEDKNQASRRKHGVSFEEARSVFLDEQAIQFLDETHSIDEDRFLMLGRSARLRVLLVSHTYRDGDSAIRIISARQATRKERLLYVRRKP